MFLDSPARWSSAIRLGSFQSHQIGGAGGQRKRADKPLLSEIADEIAAPDATVSTLDDGIKKPPVFECE
jgi:hypothetical protein